MPQHSMSKPSTTAHALSETKTITTTEANPTPREFTDLERYVATRWNYRVDGNELKVFPCPFCGKGEVSNPKFGIHNNPGSPKHGLFSCFNAKCKAKGNLWSLESKFGVLDPSAAIAYTPSVISDEHEAEPITMDDIQEMHELLLEDNSMMNYLFDNFGWTFETVLRLRLGVGHKNFSGVTGGRRSKALAIPYFDADGNPVYVKYRSIVESTKLRFIGSYGHKNPIFNAAAIYPNMNHLFIVEGEKDAISLLNLGEPNVIGIPGAGRANKEWEDLLAQPRQRITIFDNDEAGREGLKHFQKRYPNLSFTDVRISDEDGVKDVTDWLNSQFTVSIRGEKDSGVQPKWGKCFYNLRMRLELPALDPVNDSGLMDTYLKNCYVRELRRKSNQICKHYISGASNHASCEECRTYVPHNGGIQ
jgi:5S rRNA maturation endonuclease (ribonuclease M5)